jgi:hypothetical protein
MITFPGSLPMRFGFPELISIFTGQFDQILPCNSLPSCILRARQSTSQLLVPDVLSDLIDKSQSLMKKTILFFSVLVFFSHNCHSQKPFFGMFAGPQALSTKYMIRHVKQANENKYGFQAGFGWKVPFEAPMFFSPAVFYSLKGYKVTFNQFAYPPDTAARDNNTTIHTLELAFLLQVDMSKKPNHVFVKIGPTLDFQLFGKEKFNLKTGAPVKRNMPFDFSAYGHYSANVIAQLGFETGGGFILFAHYSYGLASINNSDGGPRIHYRIYGFSIGKYFNSRKIVIDTRNRE